MATPNQQQANLQAAEDRNVAAPEDQLAALGAGPNFATPLAAPIDDALFDSAALFIDAGVAHLPKEALIVRAFAGDNAAVTALLDGGGGGGVDVNALVGRWGFTALAAAARNGKVDMCRLLLARGAALNTKDNKDGYTALHYACNEGHADAAATLVDAGADVNARSKHRATPLALASQAGHLAIVEGLLAAGADINAANNNGCTPLMVATVRGYLSVVKLLLRHKPALEVKDAEHGCTALLLACKEGYTYTAAALIDAHADVHARDNNGMTPLLLTVDRPNVSPAILEKLLAAGAGINATDNNGRTPLLLALIRGHTDTVKLLLLRRHKPALEAKENATGCTALHWACLNDLTDTVIALVNAKADVHARSMSGSTPLLLASVKGNTAIVEKLLAAHADVNARSNDLRTALHWCATNGAAQHVEAVRLLLAAGANINAVDGQRDTPLLLASREGYVGVVKLLLQRKPALEAKDGEHGLTALRWACHNGHADVAAALIAAGADVHASDCDGYTPLWAAFERFRDDAGVAEALLAAGAVANDATAQDVTLLMAAAARGDAALLRVLLQHARTRPETLAVPRRTVGPTTAADLLARALAPVLAWWRGPV